MKPRETRSARSAAANASIAAAPVLGQPLASPGDRVSQRVRQRGEAIGEGGRRADRVRQRREHRELGDVRLRRRHRELAPGMDSQASLGGRREGRLRLVRDRHGQRTAPSSRLDNRDDVRALAGLGNREHQAVTPVERRPVDGRDRRLDQAGRKPKVRLEQVLGVDRGVIRGTAAGDHDPARAGAFDRSGDVGELAGLVEHPLNGVRDLADLAAHLRRGTRGGVDYVTVLNCGRYGRFASSSASRRGSTSPMRPPTSGCASRAARTSARSPDAAARIVSRS